MIYYLSGKFGSRRGVDVGSIKLHPSGLPHGPQPGLVEKSIGMHETSELAVMCDTFHPLKFPRSRCRLSAKRRHSSHLRQKLWSFGAVVAA